MKTIILDTSFLVACAEFRIDYQQEIARIIHEPYTLAVIDKTIQELESLTHKDKKRALAAKLAKQILTKKKVQHIKTSEGNHVDTLILKYSTPQMLVATIDAALKTRLWQKNIGTLVIRQKKYVALE